MRDAISAIVQRLHVAVTFYSVLALVLVFVVRQNFLQLNVDFISRCLGQRFHVIVRYCTC